MFSNAMNRSRLAVGTETWQSADVEATGEDEESFNDPVQGSLSLRLLATSKFLRELIDIET